MKGVPWWSLIDQNYTVYRLSLDSVFYAGIGASDFVSVALGLCPKPQGIWNQDDAQPSVILLSRQCPA